MRADSQRSQGRREYHRGEGELLKKAEGDESWLKMKLDAGDTSLEPLVLRPFIDCVNEYCCTKVSKFG